MEGTVPDSIPNFTPCNTNPKLLQAAINKIIVLKNKPETSTLGTPTCKHTIKKRKLNPVAGAMDFTKAGLFCCKERTPIMELFSINFTKKHCFFFCFHDKKCSKPNPACNFDHIGNSDKIPTEDQAKILEHSHATQGEKVWFDANTFAKHRAMVPNKLAHLLGDSKGPISAVFS